MKDLKIVSLQAENIKRLVAVEIKPDGNLVQITGDNAQGKSSIFDAIWWALSGLSNVQLKPIRDGQEEALVRLDLGEVKVVRTFQKKKDGTGFDSHLTVESAEGARFPSPQAMLDKFLGALTFDPLAFSRMASKEQFDHLKKFVPGVDFDKLEIDNKTDFITRAALNKEASNARGAEASLASAPKEEPKKIDEKILTDRLTNAAKKNQAINEERAARKKSFKEMVEDPLAKAEAHQTRVVELNQQVQTLEKEADQLRAQAAKNADSLNAQTPLESLEDVDSINRELEEARRANVSRELWDRKQQVRKKAEEAELKASKLSAQMVARQEAKIKAIAESKLPVPGMSLGDGVVLLNDVPFDQASDGEKLLASTKMAMAANPTLRLVLIKDGSLLDKKAMESLAKIAEENNFQIWIERVEGSGKVGFVIEDGRVKTGN